MTFLMFLFFVIFIIGIQFAPANQYYDDHISLEKSNSLKGIFVVFVFFRHLSQYVELTAGYERVFVFIDHYLGQMIVTMFLFFSGYGVMESIKKRGTGYALELPRYRALKVWVHFGVALLLFQAFNLATGKKFIPGRFVLSLLCWESIGNSNWYIMAIILSYLAVFSAFWLCRGKEKQEGVQGYRNQALIATVFICLVIVVLIFCRPSRYYNTMLCFAMGLWYSLYGMQVEQFIKRTAGRYWGMTLLSLGAFYVCNHFRGVHVVVHECAAMLFVWCVLLLTLKVCPDNRFLRFMGKHVFSIYILQRLPMRLFDKVLHWSDHIFLYFSASFVLTIVMAVVFDRAMNYLDRLLFQKKERMDEQDMFHFV